MLNNSQNKSRKSVYEKIKGQLQLCIKNRFGFRIIKFQYKVNLYDLILVEDDKKE